MIFHHGKTTIKLPFVITIEHEDVMRVMRCHDGHLRVSPNNGGQPRRSTPHDNIGKTNAF